MSKKNRAKTNQTTVSAGKMEAFSFGEAEPVLEGYDLFYLGCYTYGSKYYEPPTDLKALAKLYRATAHHGSALQVKRNILTSIYLASKYLSAKEFAKAVIDFLIFGNCYFHILRNQLGGIVKLECLPALFMRVGLKNNYYWLGDKSQLEIEVAGADVLHLMEPDVNQELYGVPDYLGALQSVQLNEAATLFRRKYYKNGSHAGFILYMTDPAQEQKDVDNLRTALKDAKGPGNFRNLFMYAPNGKKDGLQLIPVSEVAAKDDFLSIKKSTRDDTLAGHRVPPLLMGIVPDNVGGFGDPAKVTQVFVLNELTPLKRVFEQLNDELKMKVIAFKEYEV